MDSQKELIAEFDQESATTRKVLAAIPADADFSFKPHEKSMSLGRLAGHVAELAGGWGTATLALDKLETSPEKPHKPILVEDVNATLALFDREVAEVKSLLAGMTPEKWEQHWQFVGNGRTFIDLPKYQVWRTWVINHMVHHRGQLSVYLRLIGARVPSLYGPSADAMPGQ